MSINESFYNKKVGATQTDPDLALRHIYIFLAFLIKYIWRLNRCCGKDLFSMGNVEIIILRKSWVRKIVLLKSDFLQIFPAQAMLFSETNKVTREFQSFFSKMTFMNPRRLQLGYLFPPHRTHITCVSEELKGEMNKADSHKSRGPRTQQPTDWRTNRRMDKAAYRVACTLLKKTLRGLSFLFPKPRYRPKCLYGNIIPRS